jgi:hypothetical protein
MFTAKNENELITLLKVISEEAVSFSKEKLKEEKDPYTNYFDDRLASEKQRLFEEEEGEVEDEEEEEEVVQEPEAESEPDAEETQDEEPAPEESSPEQTATLGSSLETLEKSINLMRSGRSLRDSQISNQLEVYYDRLEEDERNVLSLFIRELSKILAGNIQGTDAADPSDPPPDGLNVDIVSKDAEPEEQAAPQQEPEADLSPEEGEEEAVEDEEQATPGEDTTPPIRVNESQDITQLRRKVRKLFLS